MCLSFSAMMGADKVVRSFVENLRPMRRRDRRSSGDSER